MHTRVKSVSNGLTELRERSESERVRVDSLNNTCESLSQNLKASDVSVYSNVLSLRSMGTLDEHRFDLSLNGPYSNTEDIF